jgi:aminoglycoside 6-adenylyltransferase
VKALGKGLKHRLPADIWVQVEQSFAGASIVDNWDALAHMLALFRQVAIEVGEQLGDAYPDDLHQRVCAYVKQIKQLERSIA